MSTYYWTCGSGRLNLELTLDEAESCNHSDDCEADVLDLMREPHIAAQLSKLPPAHVAAELREYGAWEPEELADHDANCKRLLWLACCDVSENPDTYRGDA